MKNAVYAVVIAVCILGAVLVFMHRKSGGGGIDKLDSSKMIWVKCVKCNQSYEMSEKEYYKEQKDKVQANPTPMPVALPLTCQKCGQDGIRLAFKCANCGEVSFMNSVPNDFPDRCPKCKHSATEDNRKANLARRGQ